MAKKRTAKIEIHLVEQAELDALNAEVRRAHPPAITLPPTPDQELQIIEPTVPNNDPPLRMITVKGSPSPQQLADFKQWWSQQLASISATPHKQPEIGGTTRQGVRNLDTPRNGRSDADKSEAARRLRLLEEESQSLTKAGDHYGKLPRYYRTCG